MRLTNPIFSFIYWPIEYVHCWKEYVDKFQWFVKQQKFCDTTFCIPFLIFQYNLLHFTYSTNTQVVQCSLEVLKDKWIFLDMYIHLNTTLVLGQCDLNLKNTRLKTNLLKSYRYSTILLCIVFKNMNRILEK